MLELPQFWKEKIPNLFSVDMVLINCNISLSKIAETSQFEFKPINIGLLIEKYSQ